MRTAIAALIASFVLAFAPWEHPPAPMVSDPSTGLPVQQAYAPARGITYCESR